MAEDKNLSFTPAPVPTQASTAPVNPTTPEQASAAMERQRALSKRIESSKEAHIKPGNPEVDTKLTTADHVGQHPAQPYKPDADEARKVSDFERIGAKPGEAVETTPVAPAGGEDDAEPTDHVVLNPDEDPEEAAKRVHSAAKLSTAGELKPVEGEAALPPSSATERDVANLPRSGASPLPGETTGGGAKAPGNPGGANGEQ